ncbi:MAG: hypothetical protein HYS56_01010 [Candidatus Omnitrophica bacterium]|nr:hypothetical protein [Candidatus Omnitrophota bacterium]
MKSSRLLWLFLVLLAAAQAQVGKLYGPRSQVDVLSQESVLPSTGDGNEAAGEIADNQKTVRSHFRENWPDIVGDGALVFDADGVFWEPKGGKLPGEQADHLARLLTTGVRIAVITSNAREVQFERLVDPVKTRLKELGQVDKLANLTLYTSKGALKTIFNKWGEEVSVDAYNAVNLFPEEHVEIIRSALEDILLNDLELKQVIEKVGEDEIRKRLDKHLSYLTKQTPFLPSRFRREEFRLNVYDGGSGKELIPSNALLDEDKKVASPLMDFRDRVQLTLRRIPEYRGDTAFRDIIIRKLREKVAPAILAKYSINATGEGAIDMQKASINKAAALSDYRAVNNLDPKHVHYFGDEFFTEGDADAPILTMKDVHVYAVCAEGKNGYQNADGMGRWAVRIGNDYKAVYDLLRFLQDILGEQGGLLRQL